MFGKDKSVKLAKVRKKQKKQVLQKHDTYNYLKGMGDGQIEIKFAPTLNDKYQVLDDYYSWLSDEERDANLAQNLTKYKQILHKKEFLKGDKRK